MHHLSEAVVVSAAERPLRLSPVEQLLCACARRAGDQARERVAVLASDAVDWKLLPGLLRRHGLQALGVSHLAAVRDRIPAPVWRELHTAAMAARADALAQWAELLRILRRCEAAEVHVLPYKGPVLGWEAYGDLGARPSVDLDLLVRPDQFERASDALRELGYRSEYHFPRARDQWFRRVDGDYPFQHADTGRLVELHVRAMSRRFGPQPSTAELWTRRRETTVLGTPVAQLGEDDQFYLQVVHGAKHRWERLEWIAATAELLRSRNGDLSALHTARYPEQRAVLLGCRLAHELLDAPVGTDTASRIARDPAVARLADAARRHLFRDPYLDDGAVNDTAAKLWFNYRLQRGAFARVRFLYRWIAWPSPEDWEHLQIPDPMFFLYRITRPMRLLWRYARPEPGAPNRPEHA